MKPDTEAGLKVPADRHGGFCVEDSTAGQTALDGVKNYLWIESGASCQDQRFAHSRDITGDHDLVRQLGDISGAYGARKEDTRTHRLENGLNGLEYLGVAADHDGESAVNRFWLTTADGG